MILCKVCQEREAKARGMCFRCYQRVNYKPKQPKVFPVHVARPAGDWLDQQTFKSDKHGLCRTENGAVAMSEMPRVTLRNYFKKPSRYNDGEKMFTFEVPPPIGRNRKLVRVVPDSVLDPVAANYRKAHEIPETAKPIPDDDDAYLTRAELMEKLSVGEWFVSDWKDKPSKLRRGEAALRHRLEFSEDAQRARTEQLVYRLGDARAILRGEESPRRRHNQPSTKKKHIALAIIQEHLLVNDGAARKEQILDLCQTERIADSGRRFAVKKLRIRFVQVGAGSEKVSYYCLPGKTPPQLRHAPALRKAVEFLQTTLADGRRQAHKKLLRVALQRGISEWALYKAKPIAGVVTEWEQRGHGRFQWCKLAKRLATTNGQADMQNGQHATVIPTGNSDSEKRSRGRPANQPVVQERHQKILDEAQSGRHKSKASVARACGDLDRTTVSKILKDARVELVKPKTVK